MVFFTGTLQEGISTALQQSKLVVCFVTDGQQESQTWESEYLQDDSIAPFLEKDAVVLRLEAGSQEAGYLAAIFPLPKTPTVVIIKNGQLKEYVAAGKTKEEFLSMVGRAFASPQAAAAQNQRSVGATSPVTAESQPPPHSAPSPSPRPAQAQIPAPAPAPAAHTTTDTTGEDPSRAQTSSLLHEAEQRREAARKEREALERERRRKAKGKMPAGADSDPNDPNKAGAGAKQNDAVKKASQQLAERQRAAREERARVLKLIEDDKAERRARSERERAERVAAVGGGGRRGSSLSDGPSAAAATAVDPSEAQAAPSSSVRRAHDQCAIQVRLFDGSTIRTRFPATATVARDVRAWIDEEVAAADGGSGGRRAKRQQQHYTIKVILTPLPNRALDRAAGDEDRSLADLGLAPSATLVLAPVDRYSGGGGGGGGGYNGSNRNGVVNAGLGNPVSRLVAAVLAFVMSILSGIAGALGGVGSSSGATGGDGGGGGNGTGTDGRRADEVKRQQQQQQQQGGGGGGQSQGSAGAAAATTGRDGAGRIKGFQNPDDGKKDYQLYNGNSVSMLFPLFRGKV